MACRKRALELRMTCAKRVRRMADAKLDDNLMKKDETEY